MEGEMKSAIQLADKLREEIWGDEGFPVDPVTIANKLGIKVIVTRLPDEVSGALIKEEGKDAIIVGHFEDSDNRKRFTYAHELGHYVYRFQQKNNSDQYEYIDLRDQCSSFGTQEEEVFANQFAANLLMPTQEVGKLHRQGKSIISMAMYFGVSTESVAFRLKNLKLHYDL
jgi:Zn-dependent peptidase ImmA (M78 family)